MAVSSTPAPSQAEETVMTRVPARSHAAATAPGPHRSRAASHLVLCSQSIFRFADLGDDGLCRGGPDKGCGVIVSGIDVVVDRLD